VNRIRVLVADDEEVVLVALAELIASDESLELVGTAMDAQGAIDLAHRERPDVAVVDGKMPSGGGVRVAREITASKLQTRVVALSAYEDRGSVVEMLRAGAIGYLVKGTPASEILRMIRSAMRGEVVISSEVMADVLEELTGRLHEEDREDELFNSHLERVREVLDDGGPTMVFQPIVDLVTADVVGLEALARFPVDPARATEAWFSEASAVGLRLDLELAAAAAALDHLPAIPSSAYVAVNAVPDTVLAPELLDLIEHVPGDRVVIELTEHAPVDDYVALNAAMEELREHGVRLAIDDAGAGFASLRHILQLSPDIIKIDNALTRNVYRDRPRRALAAALITFADELGAMVVAEGIQSRQELDALRELGVHYGQGFFLARPAPLEEVLVNEPVPLSGD
jgi:EAL domain-containing protein (putative c-di-GMP-specific phosphodiesterase class I)/response regulator of citrate/malate metabolism